MSTIKREIKVRMLIDPEGNVVKAILKRSDNPNLAERAASWYLVLGGNTHFPSKADGINSDDAAKIWAGMYLRRLGYKFK